MNRRLRRNLFAGFLVTSIFALYALMLSGCATSQAVKPPYVVSASPMPTPEVFPTPTGLPESTPTPSPSPASVFGNYPSIDFITVEPYYDSDMAFIDEGERQLNAILKSDCFKIEWLLAPLTEVGGKTNAAIYDEFVKASPMGVSIKMFWGSRLQNYVYKTVGLDGMPIRLNRFFVKTPTYVGSTALHEAFGHGLGYTHFSPKMNPTSAPYTLNKVYETCARQLGFKVQY